MTLADDRARHSGRELLKHWSSVSPMLDQLMDTQVADRDRVLDTLSAGDDTRREALLALLYQCEADAPFFAGTVIERFASLISDGSTPRQPTVPALLGGRYRIEREVGRGGMAHVYLAHDLAHERDVAVKVVRQDVAASLGAERFLREISISARLRHPHIVPLFDSGETDGQLYYVMPYENGLSLRQRIEATPAVTLSEATGMLRDIARALEYAHAQGVMHRDIKPENVMLSGGVAVVTDFGIAKAITMSQKAPASAAQTGGAIGTPAYMAPEQAVNDPTMDHRADLYSFGCVAYELLTGQRAYEALTSSEGVVPSVRDARPDVPAAMSQMIARCMARNAASRPRDASEVLAALVPAGDARVARKNAQPRRLIAGVAMLAASVATGWAFAHRGASQLAAAAAHVAPARTLIVLPMDNDAGDSLAFLASGFTKDLANRLDGIGGLRIRSGAPSAWPATTHRDISAIGNALGAIAVLKTRLIRVADSLEIQAEVANAATGTSRSVLSHRFGGDRVAGATGTVAAGVAGALFGATNPQMPKEPTHQINEESYRLTQMGWFMNLSPFDTARTLFEQAIRLDPLNARAYAGLAGAWSKAATMNDAPFDQAYTNSAAAARRALTLDSTEGSAMASLAVMEAYQSRTLAAGIAWIDKAKRLDPSNAEVFLLKAMLYRMAGQYDKAFDAIQVSAELNPLSSFNKVLAGYTLVCGNRLDEAQDFFARWLAAEPSRQLALDGLKEVLIFRGLYDEAIKTWRTSVPPSDTALIARLARARGRNGFWDVMHFSSRRDTERMRRLHPSWGAPQGIDLAQILVGAGEIDKGLEVLEKEVRANNPILLRRLSCADAFDEVRDDPRFLRLRAQVGYLR